MKLTKYIDIYEDLKKKILNNEITEFLPSEHTMVEEYNVSRNTIRRAISELNKNGYTLSIPGKGVKILGHEDTFGVPIGAIESFKEFKKRNKKEMDTDVIKFEIIKVDKKMGEILPFEIGTEIYKIVRVRYYEGEAIVIDNNYFSVEGVKGLTKEICEDSIYEYLENKLKINIATSKKVITVREMSKSEKKILKKNPFDTIVLFRNTVYNQYGDLFEYTESIHRPDKYMFTQVVVH